MHLAMVHYTGKPVTTQISLSIFYGVALATMVTVLGHSVKWA